MKIADVVVVVLGDDTGERRDKGQVRPPTWAEGLATAGRTGAKVTVKATILCSKDSAEEGHTVIDLPALHSPLCVEFMVLRAALFLPLQNEGSKVERIRDSSCARYVSAGRAKTNGGIRVRGARIRCFWSLAVVTLVQYFRVILTLLSTCSCCWGIKICLYFAASLGVAMMDSEEAAGG